MASWQHTDIIVEGQTVRAQAPLIISASRSTDMLIGSSIDCRKDILRGLIHSME